MSVLNLIAAFSPLLPLPSLLISNLPEMGEATANAFGSNYPSYSSRREEGMGDNDDPPLLGGSKLQRTHGRLTVIKVIIQEFGWYHTKMWKERLTHHWNS